MQRKRRGIDAAVEAAGSQVALAALVGVTQQAVWRWVSQGYVPIQRVVEVEQATGVHRAQLMHPKTVDILDTSGI
jgi:DNA-binding transcriptional regulator YdaS (Cro superfamily)